MTSKHTDIESLSSDQISALRERAETHGDSLMVLICDAALGRETACRRLAKTGTARASGPWIRGWHLDGAGPARYGWGRTRAAGGREYLGRTVSDVARAECVRVIADAEA